MYLLDTDIMSFAIRGDPQVLERFESAGSSPLFISAIGLYELAFGIHRSPRASILREGFASIHDLVSVLPVDESVAVDGAQVRAALESQGRGAGIIDPLIAATARVHGLTLVTHNAKHFEAVPGLEIEDWKKG